jgi:signal peptide peptidase SppA
MKKFEMKFKSTTQSAEASKQTSSKVEDWVLSFLPFLSKKKTVSVLRLSGLIGVKSILEGPGLTLEGMNTSIEKAFSFPKLSAVCLCINSPGGSPVQSELIATRIRSLSEKKNVPVYSFVEDLAASGGYWLACSGDEIYVSKSSIVGSIGVISRGFGFTKAMEKLGIERRIYAQGDNKSVLDPFSPEKEGDIEIIKSMQRDIHEHFIDYVKTRRRGRITQEDSIIFNGRFWAGQVGVDFGLADGICDMHTFIDQKFGQNVSIKYANKPQSSWIKRKILGSIK